MTATIPDEILSKIKKCLALTKSNFEGEAANAMRMASLLMEKHGVSMAEIDLTEVGTIKPGAFGEQRTHGKDMWPWEKDLARVPDYLLPTRHYYSHGVGKRKSIVYVGTKADAALAVEIYGILRSELLRISREEKDTLERRSFLSGCVSAIRSRALEIKRRRESQLKPMTGAKVSTMTGTELMVSKTLQINEYYQEKYKHLGTMYNRGSAILSNGAYSRGQSAGNKINLGFNKSIK